MPLDPADARDMKGRVAQALAAFDKAGLRAAVRQTPLCPPELPAILADTGWLPKHDTLVMAVDLNEVAIPAGMDHLPTHDIQRFSEACVKIDNRETTAPVLGGIISAIEPTAGLFLMEGAEGPKAVGICVQDNDLAGLQQVVVAASYRRQGIGIEMVSAALRWARLRGAHYAWLQVLADNQPARSLYDRLGFKPVYRYSYWQKDPA